MSRLFPELDRLDTKEDREAVFRQAYKKLKTRSRFWFILILGTASLSAGLTITLVLLKRVLPIPPWLNAGMVAGVGGGLFAGASEFIFRRPLQKQIRVEMIERGVPVCLGCGYDLRAQIERRCPECGQPFARTGPPTVLVSPTAPTDPIDPSC